MAVRFPDGCKKSRVLGHLQNSAIRAQKYSYYWYSRKSLKIVKSRQKYAVIIKIPLCNEYYKKTLKMWKHLGASDL
jgi:hypothetical protein